MRAILQRVKQASVIVDGDIVGKIGPGIVALVGIMRDDNTEDTKWLVNKILGLRLWPDDSGRMWKKSVTALDYEVLVVSQFTLHAVFKGTKPDYHFAMDNEAAHRMYDAFVDRTKSTYKEDKVQTGVFAAMMDVSLVNDGPVTLLLDSRDPTGRNSVTAGLDPSADDGAKGAASGSGAGAGAGAANGKASETAVALAPADAGAAPVTSPGDAAPST